MRTIALIYGRMSQGTNRNEVTVEHQVQTLLQVVRERGEVCDPERDVYTEGKGAHSGRSLKRRPAMRRLIDRIEHDPAIASVHAYELDRAARSVEFTLQFHRLCREKGIELVLYRDPLGDTSTATGKAMLQMRAINAEYYANTISDKIRDYLRQARDEGWVYNTTAPCGLEIVGSKRTRHYRVSRRGAWVTEAGLVLGEADARPFAGGALAEFHAFIDTVRTLCEYLVEGQSLRGAALTLRDQGYCWASHGGLPVPISPVHTKATNLRPILPHYREFLGPELIDRALYRIGERARRRRNGLGALEQAAIPALWKLVYCASCGRRLTFHYHKSHAHPRRFGYYLHHSTQSCSTNRSYAKDDLDTRVLEDVKRLFSIPECEREGLARAAAEFKPMDMGPSKAARLRSLRQRLDNAVDSLVRKLIKEADYRRVRAEIEAEIASLESEPEHGGGDGVVPELEQILDILADPVVILDEMRADDPDQLNLFLRDAIDRVVVDGDGSYTIEWRAWTAPFRERAGL